MVFSERLLAEARAFRKRQVETQGSTLEERARRFAKTKREDTQKTKSKVTSKTFVSRDSSGKFTITTEVTKNGKTTTSTEVLTSKEFKARDPAAYTEALRETSKQQVAGTITKGTEAVGISAEGRKIELTTSKIGEEAVKIIIGKEEFEAVKDDKTGQFVVTRRAGRGKRVVVDISPEEAKQLTKEIETAKQRQQEELVRGTVRPGVSQKITGIGAVDRPLQEFRGGVTALFTDPTGRLSGRTIEERLRTGSPFEALGVTTGFVGTFALTKKVPVAAQLAAASTAPVVSTKITSLALDIELTGEKRRLLKAGFAQQSQEAQEESFIRGFGEGIFAATGSEAAFVRGVKKVKPDVSEKELKELKALRRARAGGEIVGVIGAGAATEAAGRVALSKTIGQVPTKLAPAALGFRSFQVIAPLGVGEGISVTATSLLTREQDVTLEKLAVSGVVGGATAGLLGGAMGFGAASTSLRGRTVGATAKGVGLLQDPAEVLGDAAADALSGISKRLGGRGLPQLGVRRGRLVTTFVPTSATTTVSAPNVFTNTQGVGVSLNLPSQTNINQIISSTIATSVPTSIATTVSVPISVPTNINTAIPTTVATNIATNVATNIAANVPTNVAVNVPTNIFSGAEIPFIPIGGAAFGFGRGKKAKRKRGKGFETQFLGSIREFITTGKTKRGKRKVFKGTNPYLI